MPARQRRGYPVAILVGLGAGKSALWEVFSESVKLLNTVEATRDAKRTYEHFETIVDYVRPLVRSGLTSLIVASPSAALRGSFVAHLRKRHRWLFEGRNPVTLGEVAGSADNAAAVRGLVKEPTFMNTVGEVTEEESAEMQAAFERELEIGLPLYTIDEVSRSLRGETKPSLILMTNRFFEAHKRSRKLQSLIQAAQNGMVRTRILKAESPLGQRVTQLGGLIGIAKVE